MTIGIETGRGASPSTEAIAKAPNATCESPSPSMEFLRKTSCVPTSAAESEIRMPTVSARSINEYENISMRLFMVNLFDEIFSFTEEEIAASEG